MGEGSYGRVFEGTLAHSNEVEKVVMKCVKQKVEGAEEMGQMEHLLNVYASRTAKSSIADFLGYCEVTPQDANVRLTEGLWLIWRYEGSKTLGYYLKRRDCHKALAADLGVPESAVVATVMQQLFEGINALHGAGVVHRDVKPLNVIFAEGERRFKLIDLGAAADLRFGTNYKPNESILDPNYCPPEQYCMPTDAPHLARHALPIALAMSPMLWRRHKPDRFDSYSAGLILMQLGIAKLRSAAGLRAFSKGLARCEYNLDRWRAAERLPPATTAALDADNGAGWDLAEALLRPRKIQVDEDRSVRFVTDKAAMRLPISAALKHRFMKQAAPKTAATRGTQQAEGLPGGVRWEGEAESLTQSQRQGGSLLNGAVGVWKSAASRLFDLEAQIITQAEAVEMQTTRVQGLAKAVETGKAAPQALEQESSMLSSMQGHLNGLTSEFATTATAAGNVLSSLFRRRKAVRGSVAAPGAAALTVSEPRSSRTDLPPSLRAPVAISTRRDEGATTDNDEAAGGTGTADVMGTTAGKAVADVARQGLYAGLKFTGLAFKVATGLATAIGRDAERSLAQLDAQPYLRKPSKVASLEFMQMLRGVRPALGPDARWEDVSAQLGDDPRFQAVPEKRRTVMFETFLAATRRVEVARAEQAARAFQAMLGEAGVTADWDWGHAEGALREQERWAAVADDGARRAAFGDYVGRLGRERAFRQLLEAQPGVRPVTPWAVIKRKIWSDPRYEAIPENRRAEIYRQYCAVLRDLEDLRESLPEEERAELLAAEAAARGEQFVDNGGPGTGKQAIRSGGEAGEGTGLRSKGLDLLKEEQLVLQREYERMESQLRDMEARLRMKEAALSSMDESDEPVPHAAPDGSFLFRFGAGTDRPGDGTGNGAMMNGKSRQP